jgi:hypothetical protein
MQTRVNRYELESPIEELFIEGLERYLSPHPKVIPQYELVTPNGRFRLDFLLIMCNQRIGVECDGHDFHDEWKDEWRDAIILEMIASMLCIDYQRRCAGNRCGP